VADFCVNILSTIFSSRFELCVVIPVDDLDLCRKHGDALTRGQLRYFLEPEMFCLYSKSLIDGHVKFNYNNCMYIILCSVLLEAKVRLC